MGYEFSCATNSLGGTTIGKVTSFGFNVDTGLVAFYASGSKDVNTLKEGNRLMTGNISLAFRDKTELLDLVYTAGLQTADTLYVRGSSGESTTETVDLTITCKYSGWNFSFANDGAPVIENATFT